MKASKILAGLSAASIAASMLSMVTVSADTEFSTTAAKVSKVSINATATGGNALFTNQFIGWSSAVVTLKEGTADYDVSPESEMDGFTNLGYVNSATALNEKGEPDTLETGITVKINSLTVNDYVFSGEDIKAELSAESNGLMNEWWGEKGHDIISDDGKAKIEFSGSGLTLHVAGEEPKEEPKNEEPKNEEPKSEYGIDATVNDGDAEYVGDWSGDCYILNQLWDAVEEGKGAKLTVTYIPVDDAKYTWRGMIPTLAGVSSGAFFTENLSGWEGSSISGIPLKSTLEDPNVITEPVLQNDGNIIVPAEVKKDDKGNVLEQQYTIDISPDAVKEIVANIKTNDDGSRWGGIYFNVYGVIVKSVQFQADGKTPDIKNEGEDVDGAITKAQLMFADGNWDPQYGFDGSVFTPITGNGKYSISVHHVGYTDNDGVYHPGDIFGTDATNGFDGATVFCLDFPDMYDTSDTKDADGNAYDVITNPQPILYPDFSVTIDSILVDGVELEIDPSKFIYGNIENQNTNYRVELMNEYGFGNGKDLGDNDKKSYTRYAAPAFDESALKGDNVTINFTVSGLDNPEEPPAPEGPEEPEEPVAKKGISPAQWPVFSQFDYTNPFDKNIVDLDYITSEDLFDYIKAIHDADPEANVEFRFKAVGTANGAPVAAFLKVWEEDKATAEDVIDERYEAGQQIYVKKGTNDFNIYEQVGTRKVKVYDRDENGKIKYEQKEVEDFVYLADGTKKVKTAATATTPAVYETAKKKVDDLTKPLYVEKWVTDKEWAEKGKESKGLNDEDVEPKFEWHDYYITNEGLLNVQSTTDMAAGVTNNTRFSNLTAAQISKIRENDGIYYDDIGSYLDENTGKIIPNPTYGQFIVFGDGTTPKEYSFTLSADAIGQILDKSIRSEGGRLPYSINTWDKRSTASHGPIWIQAFKENVFPVDGEDSDKSLNARVYAVTTVKTPDQIPYMYGKADYKGMYTPVADPDASSSTSSTTTTTTAAASSPAASAASGDANADTGAAAGFGIAGLLLAGAAMVCAKKKH